MIRPSKGVEVFHPFDGAQREALAPEIPRSRFFDSAALRSL